MDKYKKHTHLLALLLIVFSLSFVSSYELHKQSDDFAFSFTSNNATSCNVTIANTPYGIVVLNQASTRNGQTFNNTINNSIFEEYGDYCFNIICNDGINNAGGNVCRTITPTGKEFDLSQAILFGFIFILVVGILIFGVYGLGRASEVSWQIFYICLTYIMLFCLMFVSWLFTDNYLYDTPILASIFWIIWLILSIIFWPFIILVSGYLLKLQAEALMVQDYQKQGFSKEDAKELSKQKRKR